MIKRPSLNLVTWIGNQIYTKNVKILLVKILFCSMFFNIIKCQISDINLMENDNTVFYVKANKNLNTIIGSRQKETDSPSTPYKNYHMQIITKKFDLNNLRSDFTVYFGIKTTIWILTSISNPPSKEIFVSYDNGDNYVLYDLASQFKTSHKIDRLIIDQNSKDHVISLNN